MAVTNDWTGAQRAVIGSALIDGGCVPEILAEMRAEDFEGELRQYFTALSALSAQGTPIDAVTVTRHLGPAYADLTVELARLTPTSANVSAYIAICKEQSRLSLLRRFGREIAGAVSLAGVREALDRAAEISLDEGRRSSWSAGECFDEWYDAFCQEKKPEYLSVGVESLDSALRTVPGEYVIVAGHTSHGKSAMALQMAWALSRNKRVGFFAFEGTRAQWVNRLISYVKKIPLRKVQDMDMTTEEAQAAFHARAEIHGRSLTFIPASGWSVEDIRAKTLRERFEVIFVDYLQKASGSGGRHGRFEEVTEVSGGLQGLALRYGVTVYAMSQLSRPNSSASRSDPSEDDYMPLPRLSDLRESGQIEQDADSVLFVHAPFPRSRRELRILDVAKCRNGELRSFYAAFQGDVQTFTEPTVLQASEFRQLMAAVRKEGGGAKWKKRGAGFVPGGPGSSFTKMTNADPKDNPFAQEALPL